MRRIFRRKREKVEGRWEKTVQSETSSQFVLAKHHFDDQITEDEMGCTYSKRAEIRNAY